MYTIHKNYTTDTVERIITTPSGQIPIITAMYVDTGSDGVVTLRNYPSSGDILSIEDEFKLQNIAISGKLMEDIEIEASGNSRVTINYIFKGYRTNSQGHPYGYVDYRDTGTGYKNYYGA